VTTDDMRQLCQSTRCFHNPSNSKNLKLTTFIADMAAKYGAPVYL